MTRLLKYRDFGLEGSQIINEQRSWSMPLHMTLDILAAFTGTAGAIFGSAVPVLGTAAGAYSDTVFDEISLVIYILEYKYARNQEEADNILLYMIIQIVFMALPGPSNAAAPGLREAIKNKKPFALKQVRSMLSWALGKIGDIALGLPRILVRLFQNKWISRSLTDDQLKLVEKVLKEEIAKLEENVLELKAKIDAELARGAVTAETKLAFRGAGYEMSKLQAAKLAIEQGERTYTRLMAELLTKAVVPGAKKIIEKSGFIAGKKYAYWMKLSELGPYAGNGYKLILVKIKEITNSAVKFERIRKDGKKGGEFIVTHSDFIRNAIVRHYKYLVARRISLPFVKYVLDWAKGVENGKNPENFEQNPLNPEQTSTDSTEIYNKNPEVEVQAGQLSEGALD